MYKRWILLFGFVILLSGIFLVSSFGENDKVSDEVYDALENNEVVPVLIEVKAKEKGFFTSSVSVEEVKKNLKKDLYGKETGESGNFISVKISKKELNNLQKKNEVIEIVPAPQISAFLQNSVGLINASVVWPVNLSSQNITGINETICIIDTGINFSHVDLVGKNKTCIIDCFGGGGCVENCSISDDNGHGTHVAGIVAANGAIKGVAVGANLIGLKVLDSSGNGHSTHAGVDLQNAIDWCVANRVAYNISVISMSLGTGAPNLFDSYCDLDYSIWTTPINNATLYNISMIVAAGNDGNKTHISSPACIENSTAIGSIRKDDTTFDYNRNNLIDLFAPGSTINSTFAGGSCLVGCSCSGNYMVCSGTSMSTPHVAGAFALFRQFFRLQNNRVPTPSEIKTIFNSTGKQINDVGGTGLTFSRINVFAAIQSIDTSNPVVSLSSPTNNAVQFTRNLSFSCSANDVQLDNLTLYVWNSTGVYNNSVVRDVRGTNGVLESNIINIPYGNYEWNCLAYDENNNFSFASNNYTFSIGQITTTLNFPLENSFVNINQTYNCSAQTEPTKRLSNITFYVWNSTNNLVYNATNNINGTTNSSLFYFNFTTEEVYTWNCLSYNNHSENDLGDTNFSITFDITNPIIDAVSSSASTTSTIIYANSSEITNSSVNYGITTALGTISSNTNLRNNHSISLSGLSASTTYYYNITNCDKANNCVVNGTNSFTTSAAAVVNNGGISGGGGGGGTTISTATYILNASQASSGYTSTLAKEDKIKFTFFDKKEEEHTLIVNNIGSNFIDIIVRSEPIILKLGIGQSAKMNLTNANYYDLYVKLNSIINNKADITVQTINEKIPKPADITGDVIAEGDGGESTTSEKTFRDLFNKSNFIYAILLIFIVLGVIILSRKKSGKKKKETTKKEYKEIFKKHLKPKKKR